MQRFALLVAGAVLTATAALAVPAGKTIEFKNSPAGIVKFSGDIHQKAVVSCKECHNDGLFPKMKQGTVKITMKDIYGGKLCGVCHNGTKAFEAKANCQRCHTPKK